VNPHTSGAVFRNSTIEIRSFAILWLLRTLTKS
jgi:hypothetical protein